MDMSSLYSCGEMTPWNLSPAPPPVTDYRVFCPYDWLEHPLANNSSRGVFILRSLPVRLRVTIAEATGWNASTFVSRVDQSLSMLRHADGIRGWYMYRGRIRQNVCWDNDVRSVLDSHSNVAGGLASLIVRPDEIRMNKAAARFYPSLPPWFLDREKPHCINASNPHYQTVAKVVKSATCHNTHSHQTNGNFLNWVRQRLQEYAHPMLRAIYYASLQEYDCPVRSSCFWYSSVGRNESKAMVPPNIFGFTKAVQTLFKRKKSVCILFKDVPVPANHFIILVRPPLRLPQ
ncbi:hypothetical protein GQ602_002964 [Ophiocordyceps camponoti-floridani]|uniref:Uncharacterized protein n=1 Tax=Ophiocordyceps camponoti-floridani TaxID=2030778 RepID=A0A8H4Q7B0_9HYPO|nr:hypothetical protein GQ602_002964 [Ophiocordyceps camponoti-floridani]